MKFKFIYLISQNGLRRLSCPHYYPHSPIRFGICYSSYKLSLDRENKSQFLALKFNQYQTISFFQGGLEMALTNQPINFRQ